MKQEQKLMTGAVLLVALGIGVYVSRTAQKKDADQHTVTAAADMPTIKLSAEDAEKITKLVINNKDKGEVTLEKKGDKWELTKPVSAAANQANVKSLLDNAQKLEIESLIAKTADVHKKYELEDGTATHAQFFKGKDKVLDVFFGKSGSRGQMMRLGGKDEVYTAKGFSTFVWSREAKQWRDTDILKFEDGNAISAEVENGNGKFSFTLNDKTWNASFYKRGKKGKLAAKGKDIDEFDENKVKDLLRAYKALKATNFAEKGADTGIDDPIENDGGIVRIKLKDDAGEFELKVGKEHEKGNRYLVKEGGDGTVYVVTSWAADWATAEVEKFQKSDEPEPPKGRPGMPPGMPGGLPPGMKMPTMPPTGN
jgi:hypothetical protein